MTDAAAPRRTVDWEPGPRTAVVLNVLGLVLTLLALAAFTALWARRVGGPTTVTIGVREMLGLLLSAVLVAVLMVVHELLHGIALRTLGHGATYGVTKVGGILPAFYCTSPGARLTRPAFTYVALLPGVVLAAAPAAWIGLALPASGWLVLPAAMLLGGAVGDLALVARTLAAPRGTLVEDRRDGIRLHLPEG